MCKWFIDRIVRPLCWNTSILLYSPIRRIGPIRQGLLKKLECSMVSIPFLTDILSRYNIDWFALLHFSHVVSNEHWLQDQAHLVVDLYVVCRSPHEPSPVPKCFPKCFIEFTESSFHNNHITMTLLCKMVIHMYT